MGRAIFRSSIKEQRQLLVFRQGGAAEFIFRNKEAFSFWRIGQPVAAAEMSPNTNQSEREKNTAATFKGGTLDQITETAGQNLFLKSRKPREKKRKKFE